MSKKIISAFLALTMLFMTACGDSSQADTSKADTTTTAAEQDNSEADSSSDSEETTTTAETTTTTSDTSEKEEKSSDTTTTSATTATTKAQATTTTKQAVATTRATVKPVQTTKATVRTTAKATTKATVKTTPKATQPAVNTTAYVNNIIADITKMFPESQFNKALYDKFERLCKGVPTEQDKKDISEAVCNFAIRKFNGKSGTFTCYTQIKSNSAKTETVVAKQPINIKINRSFTQDNAHLGVGLTTDLYYAAYKTVQQNYQGISTFIKKCYCVMDSGMSALIYQNEISHTEIFFSINYGGWQSGVNHDAYYMWFCHE